MQPPTNNYYPRRRHRFAGLLLLLVIVGCFGSIAANRQNILDWLELRNYSAPATVAQLASQDTMTGYGRKIFYVNHPAVQDKSTFFTQCPNSGGEKTIVLGCYHGGQRGIYLLSVTEPRLNGVTQVTAAHEMLHGAYDRLSSAERTKVDAMLQDYFHSGLHDQRIVATIAAYQKSEPNDVVNEMHSIFGTEIATLPPQLEQYYTRYFSNRAAVVTYAAQYQAEFTSRQTAVAQDDSQLAILKSQIDSAEADLKTKQAQISTQRTLLAQQRDSGNISAYNSGVAGYNSLIDSYNNEVESVKKIIDAYNQLVSERNTIAGEENALTNALSSQIAPAQQ